MTKAELIDALQTAVGGSAYGDALIAEANATYGDEDKKYGQNMKDRIDEKLGLLKAYAKIHEHEGESEKAKVEEEKVAILEKALAAIENLK
ncbi:MAG: hypothetical protein HDR44_00815 [Allobaculum sp.]|nr:hypothetical protein [Allobaculum sp.]MDE5758381.1 hypothetical protein [Allobaculum sp.]